jgi:hypothetical protein
MRCGEARPDFCGTDLKPSPRATVDGSHLIIDTIAFVHINYFYQMQMPSSIVFPV